MKKFFTLLFLTSIAIGVFSKTTTVAPGGQNKIKEAIKAAAPGDTLKLSNGIYKEDTLIIDKKIAIKGPKITVPALDAKVTIRPLVGKQINALFIMKDACDLVLQNVKVDAVGSKGAIFAPFAQSAGNYADMAISIFVDHCRLMNTYADTLNPSSSTYHGSESGSLFDQASGSIATNGKQVKLVKCHFTNNIIENIHGRGFYLQNYFGPSDILVKNNTFINIGFQVFSPTKLLTAKNNAGSRGAVVFDNNTVWKVGPMPSIKKNIIGTPAYELTKEVVAGMADAANFTYSIQNNIIAHQIYPSSGHTEGAAPTTNAGTTNYWFEGSIFAHELTVKNNIFHEVGLIYVVKVASTALTDMCTESNKLIKDETWPQFNDTSKLDFTIKNTNLVVNGKATKGAEWWAPGYDELTGIAKAHVAKLSVSPNPVIDVLTVKGAAKIEIASMTGSLVLSVYGETVNTVSLKSGVYVVRAMVGEEMLVAKIIKK